MEPFLPTETAIQPMLLALVATSSATFAVAGRDTRSAQNFVGTLASLQALHKMQKEDIDGVSHWRPTSRLNCPQRSSERMLQ